MSYPISGMVKDFIVEGYPEDSPLIPHGISVILTAPAVFRYTALADPQRHLEAASAMGFDVQGLTDEDAGEVLAQAIINIIRQIGVPNGLEAVGYSESDLNALVDGTLPQKRVVDLSPRFVDREEIHKILLDSMKLW
jgi:hydroxyacid-oxoacid transhydrogenase